MWFEIKTKPFIKDGPHHFVKQLNLMKKLPENLQSIVWPVLRRNSYWCHSENVLISMLSALDRNMRIKAVKQIEQIRTKTENINFLKSLQRPIVEDCIEKIEDFIDNSQALFEPSFTKLMTLQQLHKIVEIPLLLNIPCHSQAVERCVKTVTEASMAVFNHAARHGFIQARLKSRSINPTLNSKSDFNI